VTQDPNVESPDLEAPDVVSSQGPDAVVEEVAQQPSRNPAPEGDVPTAEPGGLSSDAAGDAGGEDELSTVRRELAERTADLQRLQAVFLN
jgi:hypothetical protein